MTVRKAHLLIALVVALLVPASAQALQDRSFVPASGDWNDPANWSPVGVPGSGDRAIVGAGKTANVGATPAAIPDEVQLGGTISVAAGATLTVGSSMTVNGGTLTGPGAVELASGSTMSISSLTLNLGMDLTLGTTTIWSAGAIGILGDPAVNTDPSAFTSLVVPAGATFQLLDGGTIGTNTTAESSRIVNNGTITKSGPGLTRVRPRFLNAGALDAAAGTLQVDAGPPANLSHRGAFSAAAGASLTLLAPPGGEQHLASGASFAGTGELTYTGGTIEAGAVIPVERMRFAGTITFGAGSSLAVSDALNLVGTSVLSGPGAIDFTSGTTLLLAMGGQLQLHRGFTFTLPPGAGTTWSSGAIGLIGNFGATSLVVPAGGVFPLLDGGSIGTTTISDRIVNHGTIVKTGPSKTVVNPQLINAGLLDVQTGTIGGSAAPTTITQDAGEIAVAVGATLEASVTLNGGTLRGRGTVSNLTNNAGTVAPGGPGERGALTIKGNYTQGADGTLEVDINGTTVGSGTADGYDRLAVGAPDTNGIANLAGTLAIVNDQNFVPGQTDVFTVLTRKSGSGTFATLTGASTSAGTYEASYSANEVDLALGADTNRTPNAVDDAPSVEEDSSGNSIPALANDTDPDGDGLRILSATTPANGTVLIAADGQGLTYTPRAGFTGTDDFEYTVSDGRGGTDTATVRVTVAPLNDPPTAANDGASVDENAGATAILVLANDTDPDGDTLTITAVTQGDHGAVAITGGGSGLTYDPAQGYSGPDSFTYTISDGHGGSSTATVTVTVDPVNDPPTAVDDAATVDEDSSGNSIPVLANDSDPEGDALRVTGATTPGAGTVTVFTDGSGLSYTPNPNFAGSDSFGYTVSDGNGSSTATVTVTIRQVNDPPRAVGDNGTVDEDSGPTAIVVLANDTDPEGDTLAITDVTQGTHGAVSITGGGSGLTYDPAQSYDGADSFTYTVSDGHGGSAVGLVHVTVQPILRTAIAFRSGRTGGGDIYVMEDDGSGQTRLTTDPSFDTEPTWSPDGTKIAFVRGTTSTADIYVMNADGSGQTRLTIDAAVDLEPDWSPDGTKIAFRSTRSGGGDIYVMNADGSGQTRLTFVAASDEEPAWSPDGTKIAFARGNTGTADIFVMNANGSAQTRLTTDIADDTEPAWSPDGTKIAFRSNRTGGGDIYAMNADGSGQTRLTTDDAGEQEPTWSPNGSQIAFASMRTGSFAIFAMNADGSAPTALTAGQNDVAPAWSRSAFTPLANRAPDAVDDAAAVEEDSAATPISVLANDVDADGDALTITVVTQGAHGLVERTGGGTGLTYDPQQNYVGSDTFTYTVSDSRGGSDTATVTVTVEQFVGIAFASNRTGSGDIYLMQEDGSAQTRLTMDSSADATPVWSPNRSKIAFRSNRTGNGDIYVMNADSSAQTRLTMNSAFDGEPAWSPDSSKIAFTSNRTGNGDIYVMNADGTQQTRLTFHATAFEGEPTWSHDGTKIAFARNAGNFDVMVMNADGSAQTRLTTDTARDSEPSWSPDGTKIAFASLRTGGGDVYVMNADGTGSTRLTADAAFDGDPSWSPDGTRIAFMSVRTGGRDIYTMQADGSAQTRLTADAAFDVEPAWSTPRLPNRGPNAVGDSVGLAQDSGPTPIAVLANDTDPDADPLTISDITQQGAHGVVAITGGGSGLTYAPAQGYFGPDEFTYTVSDSSGATDTAIVRVTVHEAGTEILFASSRTGGGDIYVMQDDGTAQMRLTNHAALDVEPAWSPDRTRVAFRSTRTGNSEIYVMNADGTGQTRVTTNTTADTTPAWSPDGTRIAFTSNRTGNGDIYLMNADGTGQTRVTTNTTADTAPAWSPDGTRIVFTSNRTGNGDIYVMNADGTGQTRLTNHAAPDVLPAWSPDGTRIVFTSNRTGNFDIYLMNADGTGQTRLTSDPATDQAASWSPDGTKIAFASSRTGGVDVYMMNADGSGQTRLTTDPIADNDPAWSSTAPLAVPNRPPDAVNDSVGVAQNAGPTMLGVLANDTDPDSDTLTITGVTQGTHGIVAITGDGAGVAYDPEDGYIGPDSFTYTVSDGRGGTDTAIAAVTVHRAGTEILFVNFGAGFGDVYVMLADGSGATRLTSDPERDLEPAWSPDRTKIAFMSARTGNFDIYVMNADGSAQTRLTTGPAVDGEPAWSPDGAKIAFASIGAFGLDVYVMNADGTGRTRLTTDGTAAEPAWSPDGTKIAYLSGRTGNGDIYVMDADGSGQTRLTTNATFDGDPAWSPDGTKIAFASNRTGGGDVYVMNPGGTGQTRLTIDAALDSQPSWSPDGSQIAFRSNRTGGGDIYVMNADGSGQTRLTAGPAAETAPAWSSAFVALVNGAPTAADDSAGVSQNTGPNGINVLGNDSDPDGDPLTISSITQSAHGVVTTTGGGAGVSYDPDQGYVGPDSFIYTLSDGRGGTDTATVDVTVTAPA